MTEATVKDKLLQLRQRALEWALRRVDLDKFVYGDQFETSPQENYQYAQGTYRIHPWVYTAVRVCSQSAARVPIHTYRAIVSGDKIEEVPAPGHPIAQLLRKPNPEMSGYRLIESTIAFKKLDGNAYWMLVRATDNSPVSAIIPLRPDRVRLALNDNGVIVGYLYNAGGEEMPIEVNEMIHHRQFSSTSDHFGLGDMQAAMNTVKDDFELRRYNYNYFKNSAIPRGALKTQNSVNKAEYRRIAARWLHAHQGSAYAHRIAILEKGLEWQDIGMKPQEMDFVVRHKMNRNEIGSVFGVPPNKMNDFESGKWNSESQERQFVHDTIEPQLIEIADTINLNSWKLTGPVRAMVDNIVTRFDISSIPAIRRERQEMEKADNEAIKIGRRTINEVRGEQNREPVPWGDTYWKPANLVDVNTGAMGLATDNGTADTVAADAKPRLITCVTPQQQRALELRSVWSSYNIKQEKFEQQIRGFFVRLVRAQENIIIARLEAFDKIYLTSTTKRPPRTEWEIDAVMFDLEEAIEATGSKYSAMSRAMVKEGGERAYQLAQVGGTFDLQDPNVTAYIREHKDRFAKKVNTTTWKKMRLSLAEGAQAGESMSQMAGRVDSYMKTRRAQKYRIARTEAGSAINGGVSRGLKQTTVVETKVWINAGDDDVRDSHWLTEDEVPIDSVFMLDNGVALEFPGDPKGPVEEIVECRCALGPGSIRKP